MYNDYPVKPYVSPERNLMTEIFKPVPRRNMEPLADGLLAGDIILLWRIAFGTFTNETGFPKYFEYTYGIDAARHLQELIEKGYAYEETPRASLDHLNSSQKKQILTAKQVKGLSKLKAAELDRVLCECLTEEELGSYFGVRGIALTEKGQTTLRAYQSIVDRHPQKKF